MAQGGEGRRHREGRSFERSLKELDQALQRGARYRRHPPEGVLRRYVQGALPDHPELDPGHALPRAIRSEADLLGWLEGGQGWPLTVVSLHVISCRRCRRRVALLRRLETRRRQLERFLPKWKGIHLLLRPSWLRSSTAVLLVVALATLLFLFLSQPPPSTSPPIHPEKERISGSGLG